MANESEEAGDKTLKTVECLLGAARVDTVYRDLYLRRASALFAPILSRDGYLSLKRDSSELAEAQERSRLAVDRGEWELARELAVRIGSLLPRMERDRPLLKLGEGVYFPEEVPIDPFSADIRELVGGRGTRPAEALKLVAGSLSFLREGDPQWSEFYAARESFYAAFSSAETDREGAASRFDTERMRREALQAVERGDVARLDTLLARMREGRQVAGRAAQSAQAKAFGAPADLGAPFPEDAQRRAERLGLNPARLEPVAGLCELITRRAWRPAFQGREKISEGMLQLSATADSGNFPPDLPEEIKDFIAVFMLHPFVTSGGTRYLPRCDEEEVLFEDFPESGESAPASGLIELLGLPGRRGLSRQNIESALLRKGGGIVEEKLGLDPRMFRLVCIPCDVYYRIGKTRQWGKHKLWTHFDGYQLMRSGGGRALVGGDVRYGGIYDLCSIGNDDEREGVIARFAVVRRERMRPG